MTPYYVVLTGAIDNAGDFLIRDRALRLLRWYRPDRDIVEWSRREPFGQEQVRIANQAEALILAGGPSLQPHVYPRIFPLADLTQLTVPAALFGAGWKGGGGSWRHEQAYTFTDSSKEFLTWLDHGGLPQSVRDYHTLRVLGRHRVSRITVTGCPALFGTDIGTEDPVPGASVRSILSVAVSIGVGFVQEPVLADQTIDLIAGVGAMFPDAAVTAVFHHSIDQRSRRAAYGTVDDRFSDTHHNLVDRIRRETDANVVNVAAGLERMWEVYATADLHVGYRVHAHALMTSLGKPSFLLAEDGRATGMGQMSNANRVVVALEKQIGPARRPVNRLFGRTDSHRVVRDAVENILARIDHDRRHSWIDTSAASVDVNARFRVMRGFLERLP